MKQIYEESTFKNNKGFSYYMINMPNTKSINRQTCIKNKLFKININE